MIKIEEVTLVMGDYREIITKAVVAKGRKYTKSRHTVIPEHKPSKILGSWIINHKYEADKVGNTVIVRGSYDINVWYSFFGNKKTDVVIERVKYKDEIKVKYLDKNYLDEKQVVARVLQQPNCIEATLSRKGEKINVHVEREMLAEVIGETKVCVRVNPKACSEQEKDWDLKVSDDEFEDLDPDFLMEVEEE